MRGFRLHPAQTRQNAASCRTATSCRRRPPRRFDDNGFVTALHGQRVAAVPALLALLLSISACAPQAPPVDSAAEVRQGKNLYATNGCGSCHGPDGRGDGPLAKTLAPPPRNFRDAQAFKNGATVDSVAQTIAVGLTRDGGQMQPYLHLSDRERRLLARFVISLREVPSSGDGNDSKSP